MKRELFVNLTPGLVRVALTEDSRLVELYVEYAERRSLVGNIYRGKVRKIVPGISCAFVDIGQERDGFLFVDDVLEEADSWEDIFRTDEEPVAERGKQDIKSILRPGQHVVVQVIRDNLPNKGPRITSQLALPGRYMVFIPGRAFVGVSKKIEDSDERDRLKELAGEFAAALGGGVIMRTASENLSRESLALDAGFLENLWGSIHEKGNTAPVPSLINRELPLPQRLLRDLAGTPVSSVVVDNKLYLNEIQDFVRLIPEAGDLPIELYEESKPIFEANEIEKQIVRAMKPKVWLKHGGYLIINQTEALVAIDVNSGKFTGREDLENTAFLTNHEAVKEAVRQIRLRNLGGIIVIDLIDMEKETHRKEILQALEDELVRDRAHSKLLKISSFGLVEMTRKRTRENLVDQMTTFCPACSGTGRVKGLSTICLDIYNEIKRSTGPMNRQATLRAHPDVIRSFLDKWIDDQEEPRIGEVELSFKELDGEHREKFEVIVI